MRVFNPVSAAILLFGIIVLCVSASRPDKTSFFLKKRGFVHIPAADNGLSYDFYMLSHEISNENYRRFLDDLKSSGAITELQVAYVDTAAWDTLYGNPNPYTNHYFSHESYDYYPVVNISYEAAILYCKWLTDKYRADGYPVTVRLPDSAEWKIAAYGGDTTNLYGWGKGGYVDNKGYYKCNAKKNGVCDYTLSPVMAFKSNKYGLYNMSGNAAEMLITPGLHKGGSWESDESAIRIDGADPYAGITKPSPYIGFRPVAFIHDTSVTK